MVGCSQLSFLKILQNLAFASNKRGRLPLSTQLDSFVIGQKLVSLVGWFADSLGERIAFFGDGLEEEVGR